MKTGSSESEELNQSITKRGNVSVIGLSLRLHVLPTPTISDEVVNGSSRKKVETF